MSNFIPSNPVTLRILPLPLPPANALAVVAARFDAVVLHPNQRCDLRLERPSGSVEGLNYVISHNRENGTWFCTCRGCRHNWMKYELPCYHLKQMVPALTLALELQELAQLPMPGGVWQQPERKRRD